MILKPGRWLVVVLGLYPAGTAYAQEAAWKKQDDAGWAAGKEGRVTERETLRRAAEKTARAFGANDPRLALTLDHLAWDLAAEERIDEARDLARSALAIREKSLGAEHPDVIKSLNTLA